MKPFELTAYPRTDAGDCTDPEHGYRIHQEDVEVFVYQKRLTNAELAAEYWRAQDDVSCADDPSGSKPGTWPNGYDRENGQFLDDARLETLERFATLPSYDEVPE